MQNFSRNKIDEQGRLLISAHLRQQLQWNISVILTAEFNPINTTLMLKQTRTKTADTLTLDPYGRITLTESHRNKLGWLGIEEKDTITVATNTLSNALILKLYEKHNRSNQTIDDCNRVLIPKKLRLKANLNIADTLAATAKSDAIELSLTKEKSADAPVIDDLGRITLSDTTLQKLGWAQIGAKDTLTATVDETNGTILLQLHKKYKQQCTFCKSPDTVTEINGIGICKRCIATATKACS